jgi:plastocyanin
MHKAVLAVLAVSASLALASAAFGSSSANTLAGTVGPGFTISLKMGGKTVKTLKAGTYTFKVADKSNIHNFALKGPVKKTLSGVSFVGNKSVKIKLAKGKYTYFCAPHASQMHGSFTVK